MFKLNSNLFLNSIIMADCIFDLIRILFGFLSSFFLEGVGMYLKCCDSGPISYFFTVLSHSLPGNFCHTVPPPGNGQVTGQAESGDVVDEDIV